MNRQLIFAFMLLATLSIVNAEKIEFKACDGLPKDVSPLDISVTPNPIEPGKDATFKVSGTMKDHDMDKGTFLDIWISTPSILLGYVETFSVDVCSEADCPIHAGTPYSTTQTITMPKLLPSQYRIIIEVASYPTGTPTTYACANATVGI